ncbi:MAG: GDP-mannose 4,6-dehydratase [Ignavibacteriales bacterium]|nr:MAG: GDP-mannose 4,6-dehydratase [Ignavibacteriales bacterium]
MLNFLVTGGAGFIGSHLINKLISEQGNFIFCLDNFDEFYNPEIKRKNISSFLNKNNFRLVEGDIRDRTTVESIFKKNKIDVVVHLAARAGVRPSLKLPALYFDVNVNGTINILEVMREHNCTKMVFASSSSVYGNNTKIPFSEDDNVDYPISPYAASKKAGELVCHTFNHLYGFDITCLRFFTVYGPGQRPEMAIHQFAKNIMDGKPINVFGDGSTKRDYTFIDDIIQGVIASINNLGGYHIYNLGESKTIELIELIKLIEKYIGKKAILNYLPEQPGDVKLTFSDVTKARKELGYNPVTSMDEGIKKFVDWLRKN